MEVFLVTALFLEYVHTLKVIGKENTGKRKMTNQANSLKRYETAQVWREGVTRRTSHILTEYGALDKFKDVKRES